MRSAATLVALAFALLASPALAQDATAQAKALFNAGAQAYEAGQFPAAIQAFGEAYRLAPRPGILFSMAQANRKQFFVNHQASYAREAVRLYRDYIAKVEQGGRRGDAVQALSELDPIVEKLGAADATPPVEKKPVTRLSISVPAKDAVITLDGKQVEVGIFHDVTAATHTIHVTAPGYFPADREVQTAEGGIAAIDVPMREEPGALTVTTLDGADVSVDGRAVAATPLARPIEVTPGTHFVAVTRRGYRPYAEDLEFGRGESKVVAVRLEVTNQRVAAYALFGVAAVGVVTGVVLGGVSLYEQSQAQSLNTTRTTTGGLTTSQYSQYESYLGTRNDLRLAGAVALGSGVALGLTGVVLAIFDQPSVAAAKHRDEAPPPTTPGPREKAPELAFSPLTGPGLYGATLGGRF